MEIAEDSPAARAAVWWDRNRESAVFMRKWSALAWEALPEAAKIELVILFLDATCGVASQAREIRGAVAESQR